METPRVFISHASEDKERFVLGFAEQLRSRGIDAWLDKWEILPGDSLVDKIFEEGLRSAAAIIVVLSHNSVSKRWVREELNAGIVARIQRQTKIIPVVIDDCEVPEALKSTVWERIPNLEEYEPQLIRIVNAVFEHREKPPLGPAPAYLDRDIPPIHGLQRTDTIALQCIGEMVVERSDNIITPEEVIARSEKEGLQSEAALDAVEILETEGYLTINRVAGGAPRGISYMALTSFGFHEFATAYVPGFPNVVYRQVALQILNYDKSQSTEIAEAIGQPLVVVNHVLDQFASQRWIRITSAGIGTYVMDVSPALKRQFGGN